MQVQSFLNQIQGLISESRKILVLTHKNPTLDGIASLLAFGQILKKLKKDCVLACPDPLPEEFKFFNGSEKIIHQIGPRNLVVSIKNGKNLVEKVAYFTEEDKFNLVITPGGQGLVLDQVECSFTSLDADLLVVLDTIKPEGLGFFAQEFNHEFGKLPLINIDRHSQNTQYGKINLVDNSYSSTAEILLALAEGLGIEWDQDLATTLLIGIYGGSRDFKSRTTTRQTFKSVVKLLEKGADLDLILKNLYTQKLKMQSQAEAEEDLATREDLKQVTLGLLKEEEKEIKPESDESQDRKDHAPIPVLDSQGESDQEDFISQPKIYRSSEY